MKNHRALFSLLISSTLTALVVIACSSDDGDSVFKPGAEDAGFDTGPGQFTLDDGAPKEDANVTCTPKIPSDFSASGTKLTATPVQQVCAQEDLSGYFAACLAKDAKNNAKLKTQDCTDWRAAHDACAKCIEPEDLSGPVQLFGERLYYLYNFAGCLGIVQGKTDKGSCADAFNVVQECQQQSCDSCVTKPGANFGEDYSKCRNDALTKDCSTYASTRNSTCKATGYLDASVKNSGSECLATVAGEAEGNVFVRLAAKFCKKE